MRLAALLLTAFAIAAPLPFRFADVTQQAGLRWQHHSGAFGQRFLPETLGPGCAWLDYDRDGWQDILLINGTDWPGHQRGRHTPALFRNQHNGTFRDVTKEAGLDSDLYGLGAAAADYDNDGYPDLLITAVGQNRLLHNDGKGRFVDVTSKSGLGNRSGFSTSAAWLDYDRDGRLDLFVANYVRWSPDKDVFCSVDGQRKSYCTPEAYRGTTSWLFHNNGNGTFTDVTAPSGIFDTTAKSLGVTLLDQDNDGWPDLLVTNDTQPNKLYRNQRNGRFEEIGVRAGVAFSEDGRARAGMGVDAADYANNGLLGIAITNFHNEMMALYTATGNGEFTDVAAHGALGKITRSTLGFGCFFFDVDLDGDLDLLVANGHIDDIITSARKDVAYAQPPHLLLYDNREFRDVAAQAGAEFAAPKVARGAAYADFDNDGDLDVLLTTNAGPAKLYRNDLTGARSLRLELRGTKSNRDGIGASVQVRAGGVTMTRLVKGAASYLSQSELPLTFGLGARERADQVTIRWPSGKVQEMKNLPAGRHVIMEAP